MNKTNEILCRNCGSQKFKRRDELTEDEKFLLKRLSTKPDFSSDEMEHDLFCERCLFQRAIDRHDQLSDLA